MHFPVQVPGASADADPIVVTSPFDGQPIGSVEPVGAEGVALALSTAQATFRDRDHWLSAETRMQILERTAALMAEQAEALAQLALAEGGKPLIDSRAEVDRAIDGVCNCVDLIRSESGTEIPMGLNGASAQRIAFTQKEPIGVVVAVSAFNHPLNLIVHQIAPAIAAGCPVIVKPADDTPLSCFKLVSLLREAGLPDAWCQPLLTTNLDVAEQLVTDARVAFFSFIGSAKVGWMLRSKLAPGARCALEHGGAAPAIVAEDADLDVLIPKLIKGGFYHAGQVCVSVQRVFVERSMARSVAEKLAQAADALVVGDPADPTTEVGPLIRPREVTRVHEWVQEAINGGAELLSGGRAINDRLYAPTVLYNPSADARVSQQEIFGPVLCVYPVDSIDDALSAANSLPVAFQAAVFTQSIDTALYAYKRLDAAAVMINDHTAFRVDWMPFAGLKESGHGVGGIPYTYEDMTIEKLMVIHSPSL